MNSSSRTTTKSRKTIINLKLLVIVFALLAGNVYAQASPPEPTEREKVLLNRIDQLEGRLVELEKSFAAISGNNSTAAVVVPVTPAKQTSNNVISNDDRSILDFFHDTTINL